MMGSKDHFIVLRLDGLDVLGSGMMSHKLGAYLHSFSFTSESTGGDICELTFHLPDTGFPKGTENLIGLDIHVELKDGKFGKTVHTADLEVTNVSHRRPPFEVSVRAEDNARKLMNPRAEIKPGGRNFKSGETIAKVVEAVAKDHGLKPKCDDKTVIHLISPQNETDHEMLQKLAQDFNLTVRIVDGDTLKVGSRKSTAENTVKVELDNLEGVTLEMKTLGLVTHVEVHGADPKGVMKKLASATPSSLGIKGEPGSSLLPKNSMLIQKRLPTGEIPMPPSTAKKWAEAIMATHSECFVKGDFTCRFDPNLIGGSFVELADAGWPFEKAQFWANNVVHSWDAGGIKTSVQFTGPAVSSIAPPGGSFSISFPSLPF